jgi:hypothetical protein
MKILTLLLLYIVCRDSVSSFGQPVISGEYYFRKMEMVSGLNFSKDGRFEFFYSYGAVDRNASGRFSVNGDSLQLISDKEPGKDFTIVNQSKSKSGYNLIFKNANQYLLKNILCIFIANGKQHEQYTDDNGKVNIDLARCDTIYAMHMLYPDVPTLIKDESDSNNTFTLQLNPSLAQVSFKGMDFKIVNDKTIRCSSNYLIDAHDVVFIKQ